MIYNGKKYEKKDFDFRFDFDFCLFCSNIYFSNDHLECEMVIYKTFNSNGNIVKTEGHICKEKYNF